MAIQQGKTMDALLAERDRYVARGIATAPIVVARADGANVWDVDGREYIDFVGGIGCQNFGHNSADVVDALHRQVDDYLHQCFVIAAYEPFIDVCRRLAEISPCRGSDQKTVLLNSGAEAVENAVKIARVATGRTAVVTFDRAFHGRTLMAMTMTSKVTPYKKGFGPFAPEVYRAPAPYPYRGVSATAAADGLEYLFKAEVDPDSVACVVLEPVQGEGGFIPMPREFLERVREICDARGILYVDDEIQSGMGRTGPVWAVEHFDVEPDLIIGGKSLGGGLPLTSVTGRAELMDAVHPAGLGGTFIGNPLSCVAAQAVLEEVTTPEFRQQSEAIGDRLSEGLAGIAARVSAVGEERGLGAMRALELVLDADTKEPAPNVAAATVEIARANGLLLMTSGIYSNVIRVLVPLVASDEVVARGLGILEESIEQAAARAASER